MIALTQTRSFNTTSHAHLRVGHTHEDVDAVFSICTNALQNSPKHRNTSRSSAFDPAACWACLHKEGFGFWHSRLLKLLLVTRIQQLFVSLFTSPLPATPFNFLISHFFSCLRSENGLLSCLLALAWRIATGREVRIKLLFHKASPSWGGGWCHDVARVCKLVTGFHVLCAQLTWTLLTLMCLWWSKKPWQPLLYHKTPCWLCQGCC